MWSKVSLANVILQLSKVVKNDFIFNDFIIIMELPEKIFEMIYNAIVQQNKRLLYEIAVREKISYHTLYQKYIPPRKKFRAFIQSVCQDSSSSSSSSSSSTFKS